MTISGTKELQFDNNLLYNDVDIDTRIRWEDVIVHSTLDSGSKKKSRVLSKLGRMVSGNRRASFDSQSRDSLSSLTTEKDGKSRL